MEDVQDIFNRLKASQKEQRLLKSVYRDALQSSGEYKQVMEKLEALKAEKKKIEEKIKDEFSPEFTQLEGLKANIDADKEMLSDIALNQLVKGATVAVIDEHDNKYEPVFAVRFKKV